MAILTKNTPRNYDPAVAPMFVDLPAKISTTIYEGAAVTDDGGVGEIDGLLAASEGFIGFVEEGVVSSATTSDTNVRIRTQGIIKDLPVTGLDADTDYGVAVYASDNNAFTLTNTTTNVQIGKVIQYKGTSGYGDVFFQGAAVRSV
jgi:hypothetical protein